MDPIQSMQTACEGIFVSTKGGRKRYLKAVAKIETKINASLGKYDQLYQLSDDLCEKAMKIKNKKAREKFIRKNIGPITKFCDRNDIMDMKPVEHLKDYKHILKSVFHRAERKDPDVAAACDEMMKRISPDGDLYKKAQEMQNKFDPEKSQGQIASKAADNAAASAAAMHTAIMMQQQMIVQQMIQQQVQQQIQIELQQQMINQQTHMTNMMAMGMM